MSAGVGLAMMGASALTSAVAGRAQGYQQASALDAAAAESLRQAGITRSAGVEAVRQIGKQATMLRGAQEEAAAGGGVVSTTGSPLTVAMEDARENKYNQLKTQFAYDSQAYSLTRQAQLQSWSAGKVRQAANLSLVTGLLSSGGAAFYAAKGGGFGTSNPTTPTGSLVGGANEGPGV